MRNEKADFNYSYFAFYKISLTKDNKLRIHSQQFLLYDIFRRKAMNHIIRHKFYEKQGFNSVMALRYFNANFMPNFSYLNSLAQQSCGRGILV